MSSLGKTSDNVSARMSGSGRQRHRMTAVRRPLRLRQLLANLKVPTFDGHLNSSNTGSKEVFNGILAAQKTESGIQA
jgi:hypothetical protein